MMTAGDCVRCPAEGDNRFAVLAVLALIGLALPISASAQPFSDPTRGGAVFTGPVHADPSAIAINPAALGLFAPGRHIYLIGSGRADQVTVHRRVIDIDSGESSPGPVASDDAFGFGWTIAGAYNVQRLFVSLAVDVPSPDLYTGNVAVGYHSLGGRWQRRSLFAGGVSWRIFAPLWIGIGVTVSRQELSFDFLRDTALEAGHDPATGITSDCNGSACGTENPDATEEYRVRVDTPWFATRGLAVSTGVILEALGWYLAASYEGPPNFFAATRASGSVTMTEAPRDGGNEHVGVAEVEYSLPQTVRFGARGSLTPALELIANVRWSNGARHRTYDLRMFGGDLPDSVPSWYPRYRGFDDSVAFEAGVEQRDSGERWRFGARTSIETGSVDNAEVTALQVEGLHVGVAGGAAIRFSQRFVLQAGYQFAWYPTASAAPGVFDPQDRVACVDSAFDIDIDECVTVREGRGLPTAAGDYSRFGHALRVAVRIEAL
jgi:hypothetical protein